MIDKKNRHVALSFRKYVLLVNVKKKRRKIQRNSMRLQAKWHALSSMNVVVGVGAAGNKRGWRGNMMTQTDTHTPDDEK